MMKDAEVDIATLHGRVYLNHEMPDAAIAKLVAFYASELERRADDS